MCESKISCIYTSVQATGKQEGGPPNEPSNITCKHNSQTHPGWGAGCVRTTLGRHVGRYPGHLVTSCGIHWMRILLNFQAGVALAKMRASALGQAEVASRRSARVKVGKSTHGKIMVFHHEML
mgnify:CR=1 FL=1